MDASSRHSNLMTEDGSFDKIARQTGGFAGDVFGVLWAPRETYARIAARRRAVRTTVALVLTIVLAEFVFGSTATGGWALFQYEVSLNKSFGVRLTPRDLAAMAAEHGRPTYMVRKTMYSLSLHVLAILSLAAVVKGVFGRLLGSRRRFGPVAAVVAHSWVFWAMQTLLTLPLHYALGSIESRTSLAVFFPLLEKNSWVGRALDLTDLMSVWWILNLAIGLGVLFKRSPKPVALAMLGLYLSSVLVVATVGVLLGGAQ